MAGPETIKREDWVTTIELAQAAYIEIGRALSRDLALIII